MSYCYEDFVSAYEHGKILCGDKSCIQPSNYESRLSEEVYVLVLLKKMLCRILFDVGLTKKGFKYVLLPLKEYFLADECGSSGFFSELD